MVLRSEKNRDAFLRLATRVTGVRAEVCSRGDLDFGFAIAAGEKTALVYESPHLLKSDFVRHRAIVRNAFAVCVIVDETELPTREDIPVPSKLFDVHSGTLKEPRHATA